MKFIIKELTEDDAKDICSWKYEYPYDTYNYPSYEVVIEQKWAIVVDEKRKKQFRSVYNENELVGYFRVVDNEDYFLLGLGLKPEICGKGSGAKFMETILEYLKFKCKNLCIRLEVRNFNKRALKCYENVGFKVIDKYEKDTLIGKDKFILMELMII